MAIRRLVGNLDRPLEKSTTMKARLIESHEIAHEVRHFTFDVPEVETLPYLPGQFMSLTREAGGKKITARILDCVAGRTVIGSSCA